MNGRGKFPRLAAVSRNKTGGGQSTNGIDRIVTNAGRGSRTGMSIKEKQ